MSGLSPSAIQEVHSIIRDELSSELSRALPVTLIDAIVAGSQQIDGVFRAALDAQNRVKDLESRLDSLEGRIHRLEAGGTPPGSP